MPTYHAILFDLDGTLIDSAHTFTQLINQLRAAHDLPPLTESEVRLATATGANALVTLAFAITMEDERFAGYKKQFLADYKQFLQTDSSPYFTGIENVLQFINAKAIPWGIITNKHQEFTQQILANQPLLATAHTIVSGDTLPFGKPHPAPVLYACEQLAIAAPQTIFIGDHLYDIQAGKTAGTTTGLALYGYLSPTDKPQTWGADQYFASVNAIYQHLITHI